MWRLLGTIVDDKNLRQLIAIFSVSAVLQGVALAMMIPFLQELLGGGPRVGTWLGVLVGGRGVVCGGVLWHYAVVPD